MRLHQLVVLTLELGLARAGPSFEEPLGALAQYLAKWAGGAAAAHLAKLRAWRVLGGKFNRTYVNPEGERFRSRVAVARYLGLDPQEAHDEREAAAPQAPAAADESRPASPVLNVSQSGRIRVEVTDRKSVV